MAKSTTSARQTHRAERLNAYKAMVVQSHEIQTIYCMAAALSNWLFLAGFVVFPGTFTSLSQATLLSESAAGRAVQHAIQNTPLLVLGTLCCLVGGCGIGWVVFTVKHNYVWLVDRVFLPGLLNAAVSLIMNLVNIYTAQDGHWSVTAVVTVCIIGTWGIAMGSLLSIYQFWLLRAVKESK